MRALALILRVSFRKKNTSEKLESSNDIIEVLKIKLRLKKDKRLTP